MSLGSHYSRDFFSVRAEGSELGARICLPICFELVKPTSVVDVGCGTGGWAKTAMDLGIEDIIGVDGDYVDTDQLLIPSDRLVTRDLERSIDLDRQFDLAVCMEVAEHLSPNRAAGFVEELTQLAPAVLFSAAIPGQGGTNHINEQWQGYWASLFAQFGFRPIDCVRPALWTDAEVPFWYRQNAILYVGPESAVSESLSAPMPLNVVHPDLLRAKQEATARPSVIRRLARKTGALLKH
jgi:SAM-dependent methyltransferase